MSDITNHRTVAYWAEVNEGPGMFGYQATMCRLWMNQQAIFNKLSLNRV